MDSLSSAIGLLPPDLRQAFEALPFETKRSVEELRITRNLPLRLKTNRGEMVLETARPVTSTDMDHIIMTATGGSYHSAASTISHGYIRVSGGCRVGLSGEGNGRSGNSKGLRHIMSLCIRVPKEIHGCADKIFSQLVDDRFHSTLIISPPGMGKTTLLRELIRKLSEAGYRISLTDERGEVAAVHQGVSQFDLGVRTDVITNITKCEAGIMMIRTMAPDILAMDEITAAADMPAILEAAGCGVALLATVHGTDINSLKQKKLFAELFSYDIFEKAVCVEIMDGQRVYSVVDL